MGEVHLARDTKLDRRVALKILSQDLATNAEFQARLRNEARAGRQRDEKPKTEEIT